MVLEYLDEKRDGKTQYVPFPSDGVSYILFCYMAEINATPPDKLISQQVLFYGFFCVFEQPLLQYNTVV